MKALSEVQQINAGNMLKTEK